MVEAKKTPTNSGVNSGTWAGRAFVALDSDNRGYLFKHEIFEHIVKGGLDSHKQLASVVEYLDSKGPKDRIEFDEFEILVTSHQFLKRVLENNVVISQFPTFVQ